MTRPSSEQGFTLVELLVSLLIFSMLSAAGVALLTFSVRAQDLADERLAELGSLRRFGAIVTSDLAQAAPRIARDEAGAARAAFIGGSGQTEGMPLSLVRRGWENFDGSPRPSLQKVQYRLTGNRLERIAYRYVDGAAAMEPVPLLEEVASLRLRYRDRLGEWRDRWDPSQPAEMPRAVEMIIALQRGGTIRQLFLVGAAA
jgi:general secretion pathway protein J